MKFQICWIIMLMNSIANSLIYKNFRTILKKGCLHFDFAKNAKIFI